MQRNAYKFGLLLLFLSSAMYAQTNHRGIVKGVVINESTRRPVEFVNIVLQNKSDSILVTGTVTNKNGKFELSNIPEGEYIIKYRLLGYKEKKSPAFEMNAQQNLVNLGTISLIETTVNLDEILITSQKALFNNSIDRKVYNVEQDVLSKSSSVSELLQNIPSVEVDIDGNVSLRGSSNVLILINGKTSPLMGKSQATVLQQMPASAIERVELITNPSAKYKPDGTSGIINIVLKKNTSLGLNGSAGVNVGNDNRYNGNVRLNYNPGDLNLFGSYSYRKDSRNRFNSGAENGLPPNEYYYTQIVNSYARPIANMLMLGIDYKFDKYNSAGISGNYFGNSFTRTDDAHNRTQNRLLIDTSVFDRYRYDPEYEDEFGLTAFYEHNFPGEDHKLRAEFKASRQPEQEDNHYTNVNFVPLGANTYDNMRISNNEMKNELSIDYTNPLDEHTTFEAGYAGELNNYDFDFHAEKSDSTTQGFIIDIAKTNRFKYDETIHALYSTLEHSFGKFGVLGGLRAEHVFTKANQITRDSVTDNSHFTLFPTMHLSYKLSDALELQLNYSKRTRRPEAEELNPFPEYRDLTHVNAGNANLLPEYIHSVEFGFKLQNDWMTILPSIYYRYTYNRFTTVTQTIKDSIQLTTRENLSNDKALGAECILSASVSDLFSTNFSVNVYYNEIDASNLGFSDYKSTTTWSSAFTFNLHATSTTMVQLNSNYNAARLTPQGENAASYAVNFGLRQELYENTLSLVLTVADIFKSLKRETTINATDFTGWFNQKRDSRVIYFGLTYTFGTPPKKAKDESLKYDNGL